MLKIDIPPPVEAKPRQRCMECAACLGKDCGVCGNCMDMASFGGLGARRKISRLFGFSSSPGSGA